MEVVEIPMNNWSWGDFFKPGVMTYDIYQVLRESNAALTAKELGGKLGKGQSNLGYALLVLVERGLIIRSEKVNVVGGGKSYLYALNDSLIEKRKIELQELSRKKPQDFTINGRWRKDVLKFIKESDTGYTPQEITKILSLRDSGPVANTLNIYFKKGLIAKAPFDVPVRIKGISQTHTPIYGRNMEAVYRAVERYMSDAVKTAFLLIRNDRKVWPIWILKERTGITDIELNKWFKKAFCRANLISYKVVGMRSYYYHPGLPEDKVKKELSGYQEKARQWVLRITELGRIFEQKAIYTFVKYLEAKGQEVKVTGGDFPEKVPNWLRKEDREKFKEIVEDEYGNEKVVWSNDVWKLNREPCDYVVFSRDPVMGHRQTYIVSIKKDFMRQYGVGYYSSFVGCVKMGRTKNGTQIPDFLSAVPVFICGEAWGKNIWKFNSDVKGQAGIILTLNKMMKMIEKAGIEFPKEHLFKDLYERKRIYEAYQNHEDVLLKDKDVLALMKEKGFNITPEIEVQNANR